MQDFGVVDEFPAGGKALRAEQETPQGKAAEDGEATTNLDGWVPKLMGRAAEPCPMGAGKGHQRRQVGMDQPAAAAAPRSVGWTPSLVCVPPPARGGWRGRGGAWVRGAAGCRSCHCLPSIKMFQAESKAPTGEIIITKNLAPAK